MQPTLALQHALAGLQAVEQEVLLFAAFWFVLGALDDFGIDVCWIWLRASGRAGVGRVSRSLATAPLNGRAAVMIAAWQEAGVIGHTVRHALSVWRQGEFTLYLGCYYNDPDTIAAIIGAAGGDPRVRIVISQTPGPTTKADCLNRVYAALCEDEARSGRRYRSVVIHDSEDMVHPAELAVIDGALMSADFVQLPVRPEPQRDSPWIAGHYTDEFAEAHAKAMVVRDALGASIPAAGVGCGFSREMIARIARRRLLSGGGEGGPFAAECLTEDYELGLLVQREGGRSRFLRMRDDDGQLVATRSYFPARLEDAVRQKSRWIHGIAFQGWDRLGWNSGAVELWMALRDRRGPLTGIVLACGYALVGVEALLAVANLGGERLHAMASPALRAMMQVCLAAFLWRAALRFAFVTREYGVVEGIAAVMRIPVANCIAILAGWRATVSYVRTLQGFAVKWEKTVHDDHPTLVESVRATVR